MSVQRRRFVGGFGAALGFAATGSMAAGLPGTRRVLLFSGATGFRHDSIETGRPALQRLARSQGFEVTSTEDPQVFNAGTLQGCAAVILFNSTTRPDDPASEWFVGERRAAFQAFVRGGGGVVAIHAAADSHYHWPWYARMLGGRFASHPPGAPAGRLRRERPHPAGKGLPPVFTRSDEWYAFGDYDPTSELLVTLDPASIGAADVNPDPISWAREFEGGRVFYTAMGHTPESYEDPLFLAHVAAGLRWAAAQAGVDSAVSAS